MIAFAFPPFNLIDRVISKILRENVEAMILASDIHMADTTLVYSATKNVYTTSISFKSPTKPITKSSGRKTSTCKNQFPKVSGKENYRKTLDMEGISSNAAKLISMSRTPGSIAGYKSTWNTCVSWCCQQQTDPV